MIIKSFNKYDNQFKIFLEINELNVVADRKQILRKRKHRHGTSIYFKNILQKLSFVKHFNCKSVFFSHSNVDTI